MKFIDWEKQAQRDFDPASIWNRAMRNSFIEDTSDEIKILKRKEQAQKTRSKK